MNLRVNAFGRRKNDQLVWWLLIALTLANVYSLVEFNRTITALKKLTQHLNIILPTADERNEPRWKT